VRIPISETSNLRKNKRDRAGGHRGIRGNVSGASPKKLRARVARVRGRSRINISLSEMRNDQVIAIALGSRRGEGRGGGGDGEGTSRGGERRGGSGGGRKGRGSRRIRAVSSAGLVLSATRHSVRTFALSRRNFGETAEEDTRRIHRSTMSRLSLRARARPVVR